MWIMVWYGMVWDGYETLDLDLDLDLRSVGMICLFICLFVCMDVYTAG